MTIPTSPSALEIVASSLPVSGGLAAVAAYAGTPLAALLPVLGQTLAANRQRNRVDSALTEISATLEAHKERLNQLSDDQYKLVNETILAILQSTRSDKIEILKRCVRNQLYVEVGSLEAAFLSRVIRDISSEEVDFLTRNFQFERIALSEIEPDQAATTLQLSPTSADGMSALGLVQLGLLVAAEPTWADDGLMRFSPFCAKLLAILRH